MAKNKKFYAVANGRKPGVYKTWDECQAQTKGFAKAKFKSFTTEKEAQDFIDGISKNKTRSSSDNGTNGAIPRPPPKRKRATISTLFTAKIHFDGGSRGNGKVKVPVAGAGAVLQLNTVNCFTGETTFDDRINMRLYLPGKTNNYAEYSGLLIGLRELKKRVESCDDCENCGVRLSVFGDSLVVIRQMMGEYECKSDNIKKLYIEAKGLIESFEKWGVGGEEGDAVKLEHVYRDSNKDADALANEAMDQRRSWTTIGDTNPIDSMAAEAVPLGKRRKT